MLRILKWFGIVLGVLFGIILLDGLGLHPKALMEMTKTYDMPTTALAVSSQGPVDHGQHLATGMPKECHGEDLGGNPAFLDDPVIGSFVTPNLTAGTGRLGSEFTDADFIRVLRHGIKPNGESVFIMQAGDYF